MQWLAVTEVAISAGITAAMVIAASAAWMASRVAFSVASPFTIWSIRFLRDRTFERPKRVLRRPPTEFANDTRTTVRATPASVKMASWPFGGRPLGSATPSRGYLPDFR